MTSEKKLGQKYSYFSSLVWLLALSTTAYYLLSQLIYFAQIILENLFNCRIFTLPIPPVQAYSNSISILEILFIILLGISFLVSPILSTIYIIVSKKYVRLSRIRVIIPLIMNLVTLLLFVTVPGDWEVNLDLQTNGKRREVVQMVEQREVRSTVAQSVLLYEGGISSYSRDLDLQKQNAIPLPNQDFRADIRLSPAYQHLIITKDNLQVICQNKVISIYFSLSEYGWFGTSFHGLLYQSNDIEPKTFGEENLLNVKRLRLHWYLVDYQHSFN